MNSIVFPESGSHRIRDLAILRKKSLEQRALSRSPRTDDQNYVGIERAQMLGYGIQPMSEQLRRLRFGLSVAQIGELYS